jgi:cysteinyl-tRNA synthetase
MPLTLYNSLTHHKEAFEPLDPNMVRMYVCGPTVYDDAHIGNGRAFVVFDVLYRLLREKYGNTHVRYARNITNIDDKINAAAHTNNESIAALTARTTADFHADMAALSVLPPDIEPRATEHIPQMVAMIVRLISSGHAYSADRHVLFSVTSDPGYGRLSRRNRAEIIPIGGFGHFDADSYKSDPADFVLWKPSETDQPGWDSPWGRGRPGWHIECSAMSEAYLGETFDIHGGGQDLIFPHHENEMAQSICAHNGIPFVRYWVHNGFLTINGAKMSKSLGNFFTVRDLLNEAPGEAIRLALLSAHYRDPLDWTDERLLQAWQTLDRFYRALTLLSLPPNEPARASKWVLGALEDDLNTPMAIVRMHEILASINRTDDKVERGRLQNLLVASGKLMGILTQKPQVWRQNLSEEIFTLIQERAQARIEQRFADADGIRDQLTAMGMTVEDSPNAPSIVYRKR